MPIILPSTTIAWQDLLCTTSASRRKAGGPPTLAPSDVTDYQGIPPTKSSRGAEARSGGGRGVATPR